MVKHWIYKQSIVLTFAWFLLIFILCATPGQYIPSANWLELLSFDKFVHASIFFVLTGLCFLVAVKYRQHKAMLVIYVAACIGYGVLLEWMQANYFSNRSADYKDMIANSFGCLMALFFLSKIRKFCAESEQRSN